MTKMKILRVKGPDADAAVDTDDLDYVALGLPPNSGSYTVAAPENGTFAFVVRDLLGEEEARVEWEHDAAQTAAQTAAAIAAAINTAIEAHEPIERFVERAVYPGSGALFYAQKKQRAAFLVALEAPGSATLTAFPGTRWPITIGIGNVGMPGGGGVPTALEFELQQLDSNGDVLPSDGTDVYTVEVVGATSFELSKAEGKKWAVDSRGDLSGTFGESVHRVEVGSAEQIGVVITGVTGHASLDRILVLAHPVVA
jgi:hypothetical protein